MHALALLLLIACEPPEDTSPPEDANIPPVAMIESTTPGLLDGTASFDPDDGPEPLVFHWGFDYAPADSVAEFVPNDDTSGLTSFTPEAEGTYVVELVVDDGADLSEPVFVVLTHAGDTCPHADAGPDQTATLGEEVCVDGAGSYDPLGGELSYRWSLSNIPYNSTLTMGDDPLEGADEEEVCFTPDVTGVFTISLVVHNAFCSSNADSVNITVVSDNEAPVAHAGEDMLGEDCTHIQLDGSGSTDPEQDPLSYFWELVDKPLDSNADNHSFSDRLVPDSTFWPDVSGDYLLSLSVFDGQQWSVPDEVLLSLGERVVNSPPVANAGSDRIEAQGDATCTRMGSLWSCASCSPVRVDLGPDGYIYDDDDDPLEVLWVCVGSTASVLSTDRFPSEASLPGATPELPGYCVEEEHDFLLEVTDCPGETTLDRVTLYAECCGV